MREWKYEYLTRKLSGYELRADVCEDGSWLWEVRKNNVVVVFGTAHSEHLAKTYAMRAARKLLKAKKA